MKDIEWREVGVVALFFLFILCGGCFNYLWEKEKARIWVDELERREIKP